MGGTLAQAVKGADTVLRPVWLASVKDSNLGPSDRESHFGRVSIGHHRAESAAMTVLKRVWPLPILRVA